MNSFEKAKIQAEIIKALAHPIRIMMIQYLKENGATTVGDLNKLFDVKISTVSKHLKVLKDFHIVQDDKQGTKVYYSLTVACITDFLGCTCEIVKNITKHKGQILM